MSWLSKLQSEPTDKKIRMLWIVTIICAVLLVAAWILIGNYRPKSGANTSLFKAIGKGFKDFGSQDFKKTLNQQ